jgi:hypothetical protein
VLAAAAAVAATALLGQMQAAAAVLGIKTTTPSRREALIPLLWVLVVLLQTKITRAKTAAILLL